MSSEEWKWVCRIINGAFDWGKGDKKQLNVCLKSIDAELPNNYITNGKNEGNYGEEIDEEEEEGEMEEEGGDEERIFVFPNDSDQFEQTPFSENEKQLACGQDEDCRDKLETIDQARKFYKLDMIYRNKFFT